MSHTYVENMGRVTIPYTIAGVPHITRLYVKQPTATGGTYNIFGRFSVTADIPWKDAADGMAEAISNVIPAAISPDTVLLEQFDGLIWVLRETHTTTFPNIGGTSQVAGQITVSLRDAAGLQAKLVILEGNQVYPTKFTSPTGGAGGMDALILEFTSGATLSPSPWVTVVSHREQFLQSAPFISAVITMNRAIRRRRGLA